jgi:ABC-type proline/glycine betaine transport system ATPase subunit
VDITANTPRRRPFRKSPDLCVAHDFEEAYLLGARIIIFMDGQVEQVDKKEKSFAP